MLVVAHASACVCNATCRQLSGTGDLCAVDAARSVYYYLGDTSEGTTLVGLNLKDGSLACTSLVAVREIGFVGIGQSLNYDPVSDVGNKSCRAGATSYSSNSHCL